MAQKVSDKFSRALERKAAGVEAARKAENTMATCKMPVGHKGQATIVDARADKSKDKKDDKGKVTEGKEYVILEFQVINDSVFQGAKFSRMFFMYEDSKATWDERFAWCLNGLENLGLPRDLRENYKDFSEVLDYFINTDEVFDYEVKASDYSQDGKEVKVSRGALVVDSSTSMVPTSVTSTKTSKTTFEVGQHVSYMGKDGWEITGIEGEEVTIKSGTSGKERVVDLEDLIESNS